MCARVPQRLEQRVGEAQRQQVLDRLLAEIMVDAEDLLLGEDGGDRVVDARAEARSWPSGFSSTTRASGVTRPAAPSAGGRSGRTGWARSRDRTGAAGPRRRRALRRARPSPRPWPRRGARRSRRLAKPGEHARRRSATVTCSRQRGLDPAQVVLGRELAARHADDPAAGAASAGRARASRGPAAACGRRGRRWRRTRRGRRPGRG